MANKVLVLDIGDFEKVEIIEILVKLGDKIKKNDSIVTLESDKSSVEVPSTEEGTVENINIKIGDKVSKGDCLISLSYDHRIIDGAKAAKFCNSLKENLGKNFAYNLAF
tara:strand:- start:173 stop:499 length:327 start_codon:yes stop_codon:yes gene_type:complete